MNRKFIIWSAALIALLAASGLSLRYLAERGVSPADSLISRGLTCLVCVVIFAFMRKESLKPKAPATQVKRAAVAGLALTFFTMSYDWLSASAIAVLSNIDVPFLVILGPLVGVQASLRSRALAFAAIGFLVWYVTGLDQHRELFYGLSSLFVGTALLCFGYLFIKRSMSEENESVTILTPSLAILVYGLAQKGGAVFPWSTEILVVAVISGAAMFGAYYATMRLYEQADLATAEFPSLLAALAIQPLEMLLLDLPMRATYLVSTIGFVFAIYLLLRFRARELSHA